MLVPRNVQSMALFQSALVTIRTDIDHHLAISGRDSIWRIMTRVQKFYETLERGKIKNLRGSLGYTTVEGFDERGLAIIAKLVSRFNTWELLMLTQEPDIPIPGQYQ